VPVKWGAIVAGDLRDDGVLELVSVNRPAERAVLPSDDVPVWARGVRVRGGATLMCSVDLPQGSGLSAAEALNAAIAFSLGEVGQSEPELLDLPGQRLLVVDTRIRRQEPQVERPYTRQAEDLGVALTAYHEAQDPDPEQDAVVEAALAAGARGASMLIDPPGRPAVALVDADLVPAVKKAITKAVEIPPRYLTIAPGPFKAAASR
jgi:galactokinase